MLDLDKMTIKIKRIEGKPMKAMVGLEFEDFVIKGFRISESKFKNEFGENLWLTPPSYKDNSNEYHPIFFMPNKEEWEKLEKKILDEYNGKNIKPDTEANPFTDLGVNMFTQNDPPTQEA